MEPLKPIGQIENTRKPKIILVIAVLIIAIIGLVILKKTEAPINIEQAQKTIEQNDSQQLSDEITSATTIDNEASLKEIDKQF